MYTATNALHCVCMHACVYVCMRVCCEPISSPPFPLSTSYSPLIASRMPPLVPPFLPFLMRLLHCVCVCMRTCVYMHVCIMLVCCHLILYVPSQSAAHRFGIANVTDEFLVLLSHGLQVCVTYTLLYHRSKQLCLLVNCVEPVPVSYVQCMYIHVCMQERLKDVLEKVTIVSQHRTESLKVTHVCIIIMYMIYMCIHRVSYGFRLCNSCTLTCRMMASTRCHRRSRVS